MIRVRKHGDPEAPVTGGGETCGRMILADAVAARAAYEHGAGDIALTGALAWPVSDLAMACVWLRRTIQDLALAVRADIAEIGLQGSPKDVSAYELRVWERGHHFLMMLPPYISGGVEICCHTCLLELAAALASNAAVLAEIDFGGDHAAAQAYIRGGGALPAHAAVTVPDGPLP